ncbi:MAG: SprT family zinc-dependent metalloprotease [Saprospiraceae bacterium]|nr:SprT family zinc-dependent metalloprotease [Saprospiraceae bacterium]
MPQPYRTTLSIDGLLVPVEVHLEPRRNTRFSITRRRVILRAPRHTTPEVVRTYLVELHAWVSKQFAVKPALRSPFETKTYHSGDVLTVGARRYVLDVEHEDRATHSARLIGDTISIRLSTRGSEEHRSKSVKHLISRVVGGDFYPDVADRVHEWNRLTVNRPITNVYLKYHQSKWGSCSSGGNINLSTRLLLTPAEVQDYVILHELAHLVEMNHSQRFWDVVARFMPDFEEKERWLKMEGKWVDF